jgi:D-alanyl-D-alanine carboxypeptidase (penicillin-binding protein 5/6)
MPLSLRRVAIALAWLGSVLVATVAAVPAASQTPTEVATKARQAILIDVASGAVLYRKASEDRVAPASMTKLMTLNLLFKAIEAGKVGRTDEVTMSVDAWRRGGAPSGSAAMFVPVNTKVTIDELIQGIVVQSGNDAAIAVAERLAGSEPKFAALMNEEAKRIGMTATNFVNATGLPHPEHMSTVRDLATLAQHIISTHTKYYPLFAQREFNYRKHKFINRNPLLALSIGVDGMKTGHLKESGYGLVASAVQDGRRLLLVLHGTATAQDRRSEAQRLLEWGFKSFAEARLYDPGEVVGEARVYGGTRLYVPLVGADGVRVLLPRSPANPRLKAELVYNRPLKAPIRKGDQVARLRVTGQTSAINEVPLYAAEDVDVGPVWRRGLDSLAHLALGWVR